MLPFNCTFVVSYRNSLVIYCVAFLLNRKHDKYIGLFDSSNVVALLIDNEMMITLFNRLKNTILP